MPQLVVLKIGEGNPEYGYSVTVQIRPEGASVEVEVMGRLDPCVLLFHHFKAWQTAYRWLGAGFRLEKIDQSIENVSLAEDLKTLGSQVQDHLNLWLCSDSFRPIREVLFHHLKSDDQIRIILQTEDHHLRRLPWCLWEWFDRYPKAELALSAPVYQRVSISKSQDLKVNILAILGNSQGIDTQVDRKILEDLPQTRVTFLVEPERQELTDQLWDQPWDILFFAGHSSSQDQDQTGQIAINPQESLSVKQLKYGLKKAVANGLRLALFNSCDGLGLARELSDLHIPQIILMREPVPDLVAQEFMKYFLTRFIAGDSLYLSVREARERLQGLEDRFPFASWLPVICQNLAEQPPTWRSLQRKGDPSSIDTSYPMVTLVFTDLVNSTGMKNGLPGIDLNTRNQLYFKSILNPHRQRVESLLKIYRGQLIKTEGDAHFVVFDHVSQALQWAIELQLSHVNHPISTPLGALQLRIAMHTGHPIQDGIDYIGQEVDLAARLCDLAQPNQILVSEVTAVLGRHSGIKELQIHDHGKRLLRGIGDVSIFEILYENKQPDSLQGDRVPSPLGNPAHGSVRSSPEPPWVCYPDLKRRFPFALSITLCLLLLGLGCRWLGLLQPLELWAFDRFLHLRPQEGPDPRLLIVEITESDIQSQNDEQRRGSLSDRALEQVFETLDDLEPLVIGLDVYRDFPASPEFPKLIESLQTDPKFVAICKSRDRDLGSPGIPPPPEVPLRRIGFSDFLPDFDGTLRRQILVLEPDPASPCSTPYSFSSQLAFRYLHQAGLFPEFTADGSLQLGSVVFPRLQTRSGGYQSIDAGGGQVLIHYRSLETVDQIAPRISLTEVIKGQINPDAVKDKIVIIGVSAASAGDYWTTPYGSGPDQQVPGAVVQAHMVSQMISAVLDQRPLIQVWPQSGEILWIGIWSLWGGIVIIIRSQQGQLLGLGLTIGLLTLSCGWLFLQGLWIPWVPPMLILSAITGASLLRSLATQNQLISSGEVKS